MPSFSREPNAMYSPRAQSTVRLRIISPRLFRTRLRPDRRRKKRVTEVRRRVTKGIVSICLFKGDGVQKRRDIFEFVTSMDSEVLYRYG